MDFRDRYDAGRQLAGRLAQYADRHDVIILALPRGGVPVAFEVAKALHAPLDVFLVRKLGVPGHEELALGAIATGGIQVLNDEVVQSYRLRQEDIEAVARIERQELERRERQYRGFHTAPPIEGHIVILIDDGLATGATMRAAARAVRQQHPQRLVVAVPVGAASTCDEFQREADEVVCFSAPEFFGAVGMYYADFSQTSDEEVKALLQEASRWSPSTAAH